MANALVQRSETHTVVIPTQHAEHVKALRRARTNSSLRARSPPDASAAGLEAVTSDDADCRKIETSTEHIRRGNSEARRNAVAHLEQLHRPIVLNRVATRPKNRRGRWPERRTKRQHATEKTAVDLTSH